MITRRARIKPVSDKRRKELALYYRLRREYLKMHTVCVVTGGRATQVHHTRGKVGALLCDVRFWRPVSMDGHEWIMRHPQEAREHGWICPLGQWNTRVLDAEGPHSGD